MDGRKIRIDADIELYKMIKIEEQDVSTFDVQTWLKEFTEKKRKEDAAARRKKKFSGVQLHFNKEESKRDT